MKTLVNIVTDLLPGTGAGTLGTLGSGGTLGMLFSALLPGIGLGLLKGMLLAEILSKPKGKGKGYGHGGHHEPEYGYGYSQRQGHTKLYPQSDYTTDFKYQNYDRSLF